MRDIGSRWLLAALLAGVAAGAAAVDDRRAPEGAGFSAEAVKSAGGARHMAVTAHPLATAAALEMLEQGGSAVDAAIAAQLTLGLVEPQSSGLGGGGFALVWQADRRRLRAYDGREAAPAAMREDAFLNADGQPLQYRDTVAGGRAIGVPGAPALLAMMHREHGRLKWRRLFAPAIRLAEGGFPVSPRLNLLLRRAPYMELSRDLKGYLLDADNQPRPAGYVLRNPEYARTLRALARHGMRHFYRGPIAADIVRAARSDSSPGLLSLSDMRDYRALRRQPLCGPYLNYRVCGAPPPASGASSILALLGTLAHFDTARLPADSPLALHLFAEASRLAFADRNAFLGDPRQMTTPARALIAPDYLRRRAAMIDRSRAMPKARPGMGADAAGDEHEPPSTTHMSIVDANGDAIALTSSVEGAFGSRLISGGMLLNNQLGDFAFAPRDAAGRPSPNRPGGGMRPRSSMAPTMVFGPDGALRLVSGSPGGARIIDYVAQQLWMYLERGMSLERSVNAGRISHLNRATLNLEAGAFAPRVAARLRALGHEVREGYMGSGLHVIAVENGRLIGVADRRREGVAAGR